MPSYRVRVNRLRIWRVLKLKMAREARRVRATQTHAKTISKKHNVTNIDDVWECDWDEGLSKYNDGVRYLLTVIDVFFQIFAYRPSIV